MACSWVLNDFTDTDKMAHEIASQIQAPQFIGLIGPMGAGKTYFVKALAKALGLENTETVSSPSFALHQRYENQDLVLDHLDLYRVDSEAELESIGFWDLFVDADNIVLVEWADRLDQKLIPKKYRPLFLIFELDQQGRRVRANNNY